MTKKMKNERGKKKPAFVFGYQTLKSSFPFPLEKKLLLGCFHRKLSAFFLILFLSHASKWKLREDAGI